VGLASHPTEPLDSAALPRRPRARAGRRSPTGSATAEAPGPTRRGGFWPTRRG